MTERKYTMQHLGSGDWLAFSNDGETVWRVYRYREDAGRELVNERWVTVTGRDRWTLARMPTRQWLTTLGWIEDMNMWEPYDRGFLTRAEALDAALKREG